MRAPPRVEFSKSLTPFAFGADSPALLANHNDAFMRTDRKALGTCHSKFAGQPAVIQRRTLPC
jgi:hypothetical protein